MRNWSLIGEYREHILGACYIDFFRTIHELGSVMASSEKATTKALKCPLIMARVLEALVRDRITGQSAKRLLLLALESDNDTVETIIKDENLELKKLPRTEYLKMAQDLIDANEEMAEKIRKGQSGKLMWFVGQMMREGKGNVEPDKAKAVLGELLKPSSS